ncbi:MAG: restriction endonuclease subunit S [Paludibacteraceae bacterium]|nr:restriction endonuclease subunit S [Paludibacteraceae bacterium]
MTKTTQYKNTPIGPIPTEWEVKKLGDIGKVRMCKRIFSHQTTEIGDIPFYKIGTFGKIADSFISKELYEDYVKKYSYPRKGDILISAAGTLGRTVVFDGIKSYFQDSNIVWIDNNEKLVLNKYLIFIYKIIKYNSEGGTIKRLYNNIIENAKFPLPPLPEQQKIAEILSTWDKAIQDTDAIIKKLEARNKALAFSLLTGKKRVKGFKGKWRNTNFGEITEKISRRNKDLINAEVYSVTNTKGFVLQSDHFEGKVAGEDLSNYKVIKKNEFAYNPARINVGSLAYFEDEIGVISSLYVCFKTTEDILDYYLLQYLQTDYVNSRINALGEGGVRIYLWYELFSKIKISLPSLEEQNAIAEILNTANQEVKQYQQKLEALKLQKKGLMQQLLTGKVRTV